MCWHERVTGSRVRQLQPRLLKQRFSVRRFCSVSRFRRRLLESLSFFFFFFFPGSTNQQNFRTLLALNIALVIFKFNLTLRLKIMGTGMKFEVPLPSPKSRKTRGEDNTEARDGVQRRCVLYFTSAANYGKNNRSRARVSRRIRRSIRSTAIPSLFPWPDLIEETRCRERCCLNVLLHFFLPLLFFFLPPLTCTILPFVLS